MKAHLTLAFALLLLCTGAALAQTPDGLPPSLETVCDMETGAAYGHCNAYCEAMDCELANDGDPLTAPSASATACSKVRSKFQQNTGRDVPCEVTCPCANMDPAVSFFAQVLAGELPFEACFTSFEGATGIVLLAPEAYFLSAFSVNFEDQWICGPIESSFALPISPEQGQYCAQLLEQYANSQGVTCGLPPV